MSDDENDWELLGRSAAGDPDAFGVLASRHYRAAVAFCARTLGDHHRAEDVVQRGFLNVYRRRDRLEERARFRTFLYRVLLNLCLNELAKRRPVGADDGLDDDGPADGWFSTRADAAAIDPKAALERRELKDALDAAVSRLGTKHRAALYLRDYEGLPYGQIADVLDASLGEIKIWIFRGRKKVAEMMRPYLERGEMPA